MSLAQEKKLKLRQTMLAKRQGISAESVSALSAKIAERLMQDSDVKQAQNVALYAAFRQEVSTAELADWFLSQGKRVCFPRVEENERLVFVPIKSLSQLKPGRFGVLEPDLVSSWVPLEELDLMLIPGVAFDEKGGRLGLGKGYYDRTLKDFRGLSVGLAYDFQIVSEVPQEVWDQRVDRVFAESRVIESFVL